MLAEAIDSREKKGINIAKGDVKGFTNAIISRTTGTGTKVNVEINVLEVMIRLMFRGNVLVYSSPIPSALSRARGISKTKIPPINVETSNVEARRTSKFAIIKNTIRVSRTGKAKKNAVAGFLEETFRSFRTKPNKGLRVLIEKSFAVTLDILMSVPCEMFLTVFSIHFPANPATTTYPINETAAINEVESATTG